MAEPKKPTDPIMMKMELKRLAREEKMKKKQQKREKKLQKKQAKQLKKEEKLRVKLARKGISIPEHGKAKPKVPGAKAPVTAVPGEDLAEAEIITAEADIWTPKSARKLDEIQKRVDRMDHKSVKSLSDRYKERYGEDLEIPDIYEIKQSLEVATAEESGELEPSTLTPSTSDWDSDSRAEMRSKKIKKEKKVKIDRPLRFLDYRTPLYLRDKYGATGGGGKRAGLLIVDIILNILLGILIIKIIMTIVYVVQDRRQEKLLEQMTDNSAQPQPIS